MKWFPYIFIAVLVCLIVVAVILAVVDAREARQVQRASPSEDLGHGLRRMIDHDNCTICYSQRGGGFASIEIDCVPLPNCTPAATE